MSDDASLTMQNFSSEETLLELLGVKRTTLDRLRHEKLFPYIPVTQQVRLYYLPDVAGWLLANRRVLNKGMVASGQGIQAGAATMRTDATVPRTDAPSMRERRVPHYRGEGG